ncbi:hypothetical protein GCM10022381_23220 [Leifsonia kafniensis]|uniref:Uncharacterized protein n=1 Tax=Leifsonia kafniensis TaxID=475957 RepID=A0ABP7KJY2_9MICO
MADPAVIVGLLMAANSFVLRWYMSVRWGVYPAPRGTLAVPGTAERYWNRVDLDLHNVK